MNTVHILERLRGLNSLATLFFSAAELAHCEILVGLLWLNKPYGDANPPVFLSHDDLGSRQRVTFWSTIDSWSAPVVDQWPVQNRQITFD
jgi:hypothetical protein